MLSEELKIFEKMHEGIILFNEDGTFDYVNEAGANWLWGNSNDDCLYENIYKVVANLINSDLQNFIMFKIKKIPKIGEIKGAIVRVNLHILVILSKHIDARTSGLGIISSLTVIKETLQLMDTVYVGGRLVMQ